jgi:hypothetical protein
VKQILDEIYQRVTNDLPQLLAQIQLYIPNAATQAVLYKPIKDQILESLSQLTNLINVQYLPEDRIVIDIQVTEKIALCLDNIATTITAPTLPQISPTTPHMSPLQLAPQ